MKSNGNHKKTKTSICRNCKLRFEAYRREFSRSGGVRCPACGGLADPCRPLTNRYTQQRR